eukprot:gene6013-7491_t
MGIRHSNGSSTTNSPTTIELDQINDSTTTTTNNLTSSSASLIPSDSEEYNNSTTAIIHDGHNDDEFSPIINDKIDIRISIIMAILGNGYLLPFESFLMSLDYFSYLYPNYSVNSTFPFVYMGAIAITFLLFFRFPTFASYTNRMYLLLIYPQLVALSHHILTILLLVATGVVDGIVQGTVYAIAGLFGPRYTQSTQIGVGAAGIIVAITRIISKVSFPHTETGLKYGCLLYFLLSAVVVLISLLAYLYLLKFPVAQSLRENTTFNLFDFIGKTIPIYFHPNGKRIPPKWVLWSIVFGRTIFIAIFFIDVYQTSVFNSDAWPIIFMAIFAITNGYIGAVVMSEGPRLVKREYKELSGLTFGSAFNLLIVQLTNGAHTN